MKRYQRQLFCLFVSLLCVIGSMAPASAKIVRNDDCLPARELNVPIYEWRDDRSQPSAIVVAVHGLIMHGRCYDKVARELAEKDYAVYAPDLRGYGSWYHQRASRVINYKNSEADLQQLAQKLREMYPQLPIFFMGESLGADMVLRLASTRPELVSGLILSSPAIKWRFCVAPNFPAEAACVTANPRHKLNMAPYIRRCSSEDPVVRREILEDPLTRQSLSAYELLSTRKTVASTMNYVRNIPANIPVLIIQGSDDRTLRANAVVLLLERLKCSDQTVKWFPNRGHILLETAHVQPAVLDTIAGWLYQQSVVKQAISSFGQPKPPLEVD